MSPIAETMNLLNEAAGRFPGAISFLAGRPPDDLIDIAPLQSWIRHYLAATGGDSAAARRLGQYCETNGVCLEVAAAYLAANGCSEVGPGDCMLVNGAQEGMVIALAGLCREGRVALAPDPTYIGFAGAAEVLGVPLETVPDDGDLVINLVNRIRAGAPQVGCVYLTPEFSNPTGRILSLDERRALVEAVRGGSTYVIEDIAYRRYRYEGEDLPTLYSLANGQNVVLIESFAKTVLPGLRTAILAAGTRDRDGRTVATRLSWVKSYLSVATSPLTQAALAGFLLEQEFDLSAWMAPRLRRLREGRETIAAALAKLPADVGSWQRPPGGFFLTLDARRSFDINDCFACARDAEVLAMPMQLFSPNGRGARQIRLAFSNVALDRIGEGVARLGDWLAR